MEYPLMLRSDKQNIRLDEARGLNAVLCDSKGVRKSLDYRGLTLIRADEGVFVAYSVCNAHSICLRETVQIYFDTEVNDDARRHMVGWETHNVRPGVTQAVQIYCGPCNALSDEVQMQVVIASLSTERARASVVPLPQLSRT
ncbi:hypothetical protein [Asticcacaulis machinosus]|uniref:Uncharacterized protein n=1 Tax=Asticcacaulis machinosus TaxID=2984211 RepID=A0ABT5HIS6_9CAUL|nr:hypothetical protein [Asticcacaulis machinosus]MDC7676140.1 hypothetical protein [Asticcacaulis machinosus]